MKLIKSIVLTVTLILLPVFTYAHGLGHGTDNLRSWKLAETGETINGHFLFHKEGIIRIELEDHSIQSLRLDELSQEDRNFVQEKIKTIHAINHPEILGKKSVSGKDLTITQPVKKQRNTLSWLVIGLSALISIALFLFLRSRHQRIAVIPAVVGVLFFLISFENAPAKGPKSITDPTVVDQAFIPFKPDIQTFWDSNYFYVESHGLPNHEMMVGISNNGWQQQVPIIQCYTGTNAWPIPLNPVEAVTPVPVDPNHFTKGAIAVAVNGISIFNPYTNAGVDAYLDGQLDNYGGHCGRADDYHYHIAPLHLYSQTADTLPIAYAFDGYAIYGPTEADGSPMEPLDANHGHYGNNGVYHYHGTASAPYMIGNMVGQVTENAQNEIEPQAHANPVRPFTSPLAGALITSCVPNGSGNGYTITYTLFGQTHTVDFNWSQTGLYTYVFSGPSGTTTETYQGHIPCDPFTTSLEEVMPDFQQFMLYPNPASQEVSIQLDDPTSVRQISLYNALGKCVRTNIDYTETIPLNGLAKGVYMVTIVFENHQQAKRLIIQ